MDASRSPDRSDRVTLFLCGDVMTGRGIDQILSYPSSPRLCEEFMKSAQGYVRLAEQLNGAISKPVPFDYVWGEVLDELTRLRPDARIINLETSITTSESCVPKGINYRMHPMNIPCISVAGISCCTLANNHVLDWGTAGLLETLETLERAKIPFAGAGRHATEAASAAHIAIPGKGRVVVYAYGVTTSGIPRDWAAKRDLPGVNLLPDLSDRTARAIGDTVMKSKRSGDIVVASIHWGSNWGYEIPSSQRDFAHALIDVAGIDLVHGHSSHHAKGIEVYRGKPILYGCGDFLTDYEGIPGHEEFRNDLVLMYLVAMQTESNEVADLLMVPFRLKRFQLHRASPSDAEWLRRTLDRECRAFGRRVDLTREKMLRLALD